VRRFKVREGREDEFERMFEAAGDWPELLRHSPGYLGSRWLRQGEARWYKVFDFWVSHVEFELFRASRQSEIAAHRQSSAVSHVLEREEWLAAYYAKTSEWDEGENLALA